MPSWLGAEGKGPAGDTGSRDDSAAGECKDGIKAENVETIGTHKAQEKGKLLQIVHYWFSA